MKLHIISKNLNLINLKKIITFTGYYKILQCPLVHVITADDLCFCLSSLTKSSCSIYICHIQKYVKYY
jgi:hypothetical protein